MIFKHSIRAFCTKIKINHEISIYYSLFPERPTEIAEREIYICESAYDEVKGQIRRLSKPGELKKVVHSAGVTEDEYYFFKRPITPQKVSDIFFCIFMISGLNFY